MTVVVAGGGRMGLPLACLLADNGAEVTVCDVSKSVVDAINRGESPYEEPGLHDLLSRNRAAGRLKATRDTAQAASSANVLIVIVPAHLTSARDIDYTALKSASTDIAGGIRRGVLVSYETTVAVGGTRTVLIPVLESSSGLRAGRDFHVCYSPERVKANRVFEKLHETPKVVGGYDKASAEAGEAFYREYLGAPAINVGSLEAAEFVKLAGMVCRDVNIALANELAAYSENIGTDFAAIRDAANTDGETNLLIPGLGVGGHCTPVYPHFVIQDALRKGLSQRLAAVAREINDQQPARNVARLAACCGPLNGKRVHIMGFGFRPDVKVATFSTAYPLQRELLRHNASVTLEDPLYTETELRAAGFQSARAGQDPLDVVILNAAHTAFRNPNFGLWRAKQVTCVLDGPNLWSRDAVEAAGIRYLAVGQG